jgi:hypothetical protein
VDAPGDRGGNFALPTQPAEVFWFDAGAIADYWTQWQARMEQFWQRQGHWINGVLPELPWCLSTSSVYG